MSKRTTAALGVLATVVVVLSMALPSSGANKASKHIAVLAPAYTSPFHVQVRDGAVSEAHKFGWQIDTQAPSSEGDFNGQAKIMQAEIAKHADAISVIPIDPKAIAGAIKSANKAGIPVFGHNGITPFGGGGKVTEYIGYNQWKGARKLGALACKLLHGNGQVFILDGIVEFHTHRRAGGFKEGLKACPGVKIVGEQSAEWLRTKGEQVATAALNAHPDINLFFGCSDEMDIGAALAAKRMHKQVYTIGIDGNPATLDMIKKGVVTATLGVYPRMMGVVTVDQINKVLAGKKVPYVLETPSTIVTKQNLAGYLANRTFKKPIASKPELDTGHA
jgi:ABC-type sugar transport system substrate-binding protein